jgi:hypothetical protein
MYAFHVFVLVPFFCDTGVWTQGLHLEPLQQSFFVKRFFETGSHKLFARGWLQTMILLISASWEARITDVSHWCLAVLVTFDKFVCPWNHWHSVWGLLPLSQVLRIWLSLHPYKHPGSQYRGLSWSVRPVFLRSHFSGITDEVCLCPASFSQLDVLEVCSMFTPCYCWGFTRFM